ncbi:MAG: KH domain-containing protein [Polyangiales bacterium]
MSAAELIRHLARSLVDDEGAVEVRERSRDGALVVELRVAPGDLGKVIGRRGQTARALRTVLSTAMSHERRRVLLNILDE